MTYDLPEGSMFAAAIFVCSYLLSYDPLQSVMLFLIGRQLRFNIFTLKVVKGIPCKTLCNTLSAVSQKIMCQCTKSTKCDDG